MNHLNFHAILIVLANLTDALSTYGYSSVDNISELVNFMPASTLPSPTDLGLSLKYVLLGIGTQNYTCTSGDENDVPGTTGATAYLYDIGTCLIDNNFAQAFISLVSRFSLDASHCFEEFGKLLQCKTLQQPIGHHYFNQDLPTFALDQISQTLYPVAVVRKSDEADAPACARPWDGLDSQLKWLFLTDSQNSSRGGIDTVYRIETAGGSKPATCIGQEPETNVRYAAQYWIFGPKVQ